MRVMFGFRDDEPRRAPLIALAQHLGFTVCDETPESFVVECPTIDDVYRFGCASVDVLRPDGSHD